MCVQLSVVSSHLRRWNKRLELAVIACELAYSSIETELPQNRSRADLMREVEKVPALGWV